MRTRKQSVFRNMGVNKEILEHLKKADSRLKRVIEEVGDLQIRTYNSTSDEFLFLIREIVGQMISSGVKRVLLQRLQLLCNNTISPDSLASLTVEQLRGIGLSNAKSNYIRNLAILVSSNAIDFDYINNLEDEDVIKEISKIKGIRKWTSKMYLILFLKRDNVFSYEDCALLHA